MHQALLVDEIFTDIVYQMYPSSGFDFPVDFERLSDLDRPSTLLNLALTCRAFTDVALDARWQRVDNICNLLRLFPTFRYDPVDGKHYFDGPILESHWKFFDRYAKQVQILISTGEEFTADYDLLPFDLLQRPDKPLLPSLRQFLTGTHGTHLSVFASPSIHDVFITTMNDDIGSDTSRSFLAMLAEKSRNLRRLYVQTPGIGYSTDSILKMKNLKYLGICRCDPSGPLSVVNSTFFSRLSRHPHLSTIEFFGLHASQTFNRLHHVTIGFPFLKSLSLHEHLPRIIAFLEIGNFQALESLKLELKSKDEEFQSENTEERWNKLFQILRQNSGGALKEIRITYISLEKAGRQLVAPWSDDPEVSLGAFLDLLQLKLTKFVLSYQLFDTISQSDVDAICEAWPDLEELHVETQNVGDLTFGILKSVQTRLPRLRTLQIPFQTLGSLDQAEGSIQGSPHPLCSLNVGMCYNDDAIEETADYLKKLFPEIKQLTFSDENTSASTWQEVSRRILEI